MLTYHPCFPKIAIVSLLVIGQTFSGRAQSTPSPTPTLIVKTAAGDLEGAYQDGLRIFRGVPYAQPPVGDLRWKEPQPVQPWSGIRKAIHFGPRAMQLPIYTDMVFRSDGVSEDCLYLNVWTPATTPADKLPVLVYFYGGGFSAGDGSEYRYDGASLAQKGIVVVTVNYRLGIFGFFAHPDLTRESPHHASGNYGLMDQSAALRWVHENIEAFGGDPSRVTIGGESAGSFSVSAQMASPLSKDLIAGAIGESGSLLGSRTPSSLSEAEKKGEQFAAMVGAHSIADLRALSADSIMRASSRPNTPHFDVTIDGYFFPSSPAKIFEEGQQAKVPLLVGWNSEEGGYHSIVGPGEATKESFTAGVYRLYASFAAGILQYYAAATDEEARQSATDLAGDRFIGFSTWKWSDVQATTGGRPVYRYFYEHPRPAIRSDALNPSPSPAPKKPDTEKPQMERHGAVHSSEIEYALGNLSTNKVYDWQPEDQQISALLENYFANFIKTGDPNGPGLPEWPAVKSGVPATVMHIDVTSHAETEKHRDRYLYLDKYHIK